jgi:hypothetical protein
VLIALFDVNLCVGLAAGADLVLRRALLRDKG